MNFCQVSRSFYDESESTGEVAGEAEMAGRDISVSDIGAAGDGNGSHII